MDSPIFKLEKVVRAKTEDMEDFEGPLDVILYLLSKNKIGIADIQISVILEQYLDYLNSRKEMDMEIASDFVAMASHLMYIKTRMLLSEQDEEALSEMDLLIRSLEERRRGESFQVIKAASVTLADLEEIGRNIIVKGPEPQKRDKSFRYFHSKADLEKCMRELMERADGRLPPHVSVFNGIIGREIYPVADKAADIVSRLVASGRMRFRALFSGSRTRSEIVATFIAVLELCRSKSVRLVGSETDCTIVGVDSAAEKPQ